MPDFLHYSPMSHYSRTPRNRNLFISWSGDRSREAAHYFKTWITRVIPTASSFFSDEDIHKGAKSREIIDEKLRDSAFGIVFLTSENLHAPWIHYEVGMLNAGGALISSLLLNLSYADVAGPMQSFQHSLLDEADCLRLLQSIRGAIAPDIKEGTLANSYASHWPDLQNTFSDLNSKHNAIDKASEHLEAMTCIQREACLAELCHLYHMPDGSAPEQPNHPPRGIAPRQIRPLRHEAYFHSTEGRVHNAGNLLKERKADVELKKHWSMAQKLMLGKWGDAILNKYEPTIQRLREQSGLCYFQGTAEEDYSLSTGSLSHA